MTADELHELSYLDPIETHEQRVAWLVTQYENARDESIETGRAWYPLALKLARKFARENGWTLRQSAAIIAAYSQNQGWQGNVTMVTRWMDDDYAGLPKVMEECARIALGERPLDVIGHMPKVSNFYRAILGDTTAVTMDRWALRAVFGCIVSASRQNQAMGWDAYTEAAEICGESPRDFQAIVWIETRGAAF